MMKHILFPITVAVVFLGMAIAFAAQGVESNDQDKEAGTQNGVVQGSFAWHSQVVDLAQSGCGACHDMNAKAEFDHTPYFRLDKDHETACSTCHPGGRFDTYTCYGCHEHSSEKLAREHREEGIRDFQNCVACHRSGDEHEARQGRGLQKRYQEGRDDHDDHNREHGKRQDREHNHFHDHDDD